MATQSLHLLPVLTPQVLQLPVLLLPHSLQFSLVGPSEALQLSSQVTQEFSPLLPLLSFILLSGLSHHLLVLLFHLVHLPLVFPFYLLALLSQEATELQGRR